MELTRRDGTKERRPLAVNVDPEEGNLALYDPPALVARVAPYQVLVSTSAGFTPTYDYAGATPLTDSLLLFVLLLLIAEQFLAGRIVPPVKT